MENFLNKLGIKDYKDFLEFCNMAQKPLALNLKLEEPEKWSMDEFRQFAINFRKDTNLDINYICYVCEHCDAMHVVFEISDPIDSEWECENE